ARNAPSTGAGASASMPSSPVSAQEDRMPTTPRSAPASARIELTAGTTIYRTAGPADSAAPPVVLVHGLLVDNQLWTPVVDPRAAKGIHSVAPTWPLGSHPLPMTRDADLSPRGIARLIIDFLTALDLTDVTLVGNDTGGAICQYLIDTDHERIGRLVLTNCDAFDVFPPHEFDALVKVGSHAAVIKPMLTALKPTMTRHAKNVYGGTVAGSPDPDLPRSWIQPGLSGSGVRRDTAKLIRSIDPQDLLDVSTRFDAFTKPVRSVLGGSRPFLPLSIRERVHPRVA